MRRNRNRTETERRTENVHDFDFIFFGFGGRISAKTTGNFNKSCTFTTTCVKYNSIIMKAIDELSSETIVRLFFKHNTIDYRLFWDNTQSDFKDHELKAVTRNNLYWNVFLLSEREISPNYIGIFLELVHGFGSYVKGLPKPKRCNSVAVTVSVRIWCICETALTARMGMDKCLTSLKSNYVHFEGRHLLQTIEKKYVWLPPLRAMPVLTID